MSLRGTMVTESTRVVEDGAVVAGDHGRDRSVRLPELIESGTTCIGHLSLRTLIGRVMSVYDLVAHTVYARPAATA